jgi:hypothetical protein
MPALEIRMDLDLDFGFDPNFTTPRDRSVRRDRFDRSEPLTFGSVRFGSVRFGSVRFVEDDDDPAGEGVSRLSVEWS